MSHCSAHAGSRARSRVDAFTSLAPRLISSAHHGSGGNVAFQQYRHAQTYTEAQQESREEKSSFPPHQPAPSPWTAHQGSRPLIQAEDQMENQLMKSEFVSGHAIFPCAFHNTTGNLFKGKKLPAYQGHIIKRPSPELACSSLPIPFMPTSMGMDELQTKNEQGLLETLV